MSNSYLERKFINELNDEGIIDIRGIQFERDQILSTLDKPAYDDVFNEWLNDYKSRKLEKGEELLELYNNKVRFNKLKSIFKQNQIIPFIGAGLSIPTGLPAWRTFLENVQKETLTSFYAFIQLLNNGEFEEAAQMLDDDSSTYLQEQLDNTYGNNFNIDDIDGVIQRMPEFFPNTSIVTTNYDCLLKIIYENNGSSFAHYLIGLDATEFPRLLSSGQRILLQLHGSHTSRNKRILTTNEYNRHYGENNTISNCISQLFSKSILFLGCSLSTDRTIKTLQEIVCEKGSDNLARHYAFLSVGEMSDSERIARQQELAKANIFPIWYNDDHDECIESLLELLIEGR
ncbi:SIR2 family protein [Mannheimia sp. AT1]|uniref:SIR2 family protein n=1 Tax=Mannheimia cairinae TaxID=3025936 RepID=A0ABT5MN92_9PAST|nr:SIR2 family protein [Mannheimia cairinae]MDD0823046.1 SIR2 family protein [Mannheimia cairinae]MDD0825929.1 SIR2 family protein [Mannheimia cairinae]